MEPCGCNRRQSVANTQAPKRRKTSQTIAVRCDQLPASIDGKEGVSGSSPEEGLPAKEGVDLILLWPGYLLLLQSGQGHWSQPQPVHALRIIARRYSWAPAEVRLRQFPKRGSARCGRARTAQFPDADVRRRFVEVKIAATLGPTPQAKEVERAGEPPSAITRAGTCGPQLHGAAASASASVR